MEIYIILIDCGEHCIDFRCKFSYVNNCYTVEIIDPYDSIFFIKEYDEAQSYLAAAKHILDKGRIISLTPIIQKYPLNFFRIYIRIEEINRLLTRLKKESS